MSKSIRFIGSALLCWVGVRAVSLGLVPGTRLLAFDAEASTRRPGTLPPIEPSILPAIEPVTAYDEGQSPAPGQIAGGYFPYPYGSAQPYPVYIPVPSGGSARSGPPQIIYVNPAPAEFSAFPRADAPEAAMSFPERRIELLNESNEAIGEDLGLRRPIILMVDWRKSVWC